MMVVRAPSPDGKKIAFSATSPASRQSQVYLTNADGSNTHVMVTTTPSYFHGWSPDGKYLAYVYQHAAANGVPANYDIFRIPAAGGESEQLDSNPGYDDGPDYSPDGKSTRRMFLSAAGLSTVYVPSASAKIEPEPWGIKLGIASYTYRKFERAKAIEFINAVKTPWISIKADQPPRAGANQHLPGLPPEGRPLAADAIAQVHAARAEYDAAGIKIMSSGNVGMTRAKSVEDLRPTFEWAKAAGLPMMVCAPPANEFAPLIWPTLIKSRQISSISMEPAMARLTLARKIAAIALMIWKKGERFDLQSGKTERTSSLSV
jgi:hypothetical protein